jgi:hypothetical protein
LRNAFEIINDGRGDDDGLCESNEACVYTPNLGVYQGQGDYRTRSCIFNSAGGPITNVEIYASPMNGV